MLVRSSILALVALVLLSATPTTQAQPDTGFPTIDFAQSGRFEIWAGIDDLPILVSEGRFSSLTRIYLTAIVFVETATTFEGVAYDGLTYYRQDDDPQWYITDPDAELADPPTEEELAEIQVVLDEIAAQLIIVEIGTATISGVETMHYQMRDRADPGSGKADLWIGLQDNYIYQFQFTSAIDSETPVDEQAGPYGVIRFYDLNSPDIAEVIAPADALPAPSGGPPIPNAGPGISSHPMTDLLDSLTHLTTR